MKQRFGESFGTLTDFPGCGQIVVSHGVFIPKERRGMGFGKESNQNRQYAARMAGYDYMLCTVATDNFVQQKILQDTGWRYLDRFGSSRTDHCVEIWGIALLNKGR